MEIENETKEYSQVDDYIVIKTLGAGVSAQVKLAYKEDPQKKVAIKVFKEQFSELKLLEQEIIILRNLNHPNLVNMVQYNLASQYLKKNSTSSQTVASITMEYVANGELFDFITITKNFPERICRYYFHQLLNAIDYLHKMGLAHRDLKPDNLLLDDQYNLKVTDFGMTGFLAGSDGGGQMQTYCGTLDYMAPEIIMKKEYEGTRVDLFAAAQILFIMLTGIPPFPTAALTDQFYLLIYHNKLEQFWTVHTQFSKNVTFSPEFQELITPLWSFDPSQRPTIEQIRESAWFQQEVASHEEVMADFTRRKALIDEEQEKQRLAKLEKKGFATGGFRSTEVKEFQWSNSELSFEDELLEELFALSTARQTQPYQQKSAQKTDLVSFVDPATIFQYLLIAQEHICDEVEADTEYYELSLKVSDTENPEFPVDFHYLIDISIGPEEETIVQFKFVKGDYLEYLVKVEEIKKQVAQL